MSRPTRTKLPELYMKVLDPKKIVTLMVIRGINQRDLAAIAGWSSHSYLGRILRGEIKSIQPDPALRIAEYFKVPLNDLFVTRLSSDTAHSSKRQKAA